MASSNVEDYLKTIYNLAADTTCLDSTSLGGNGHRWIRGQEMLHQFLRDVVQQARHIR